MHKGTVYATLALFFSYIFYCFGECAVIIATVKFLGRAGNSCYFRARSQT